ncbi:hypothetical protein LTR08_007042 [Meristemomyces frigidus]|nr:hypothetical protein LTR08_007042 [Meristemomyces frigidus]
MRLSALALALARALFPAAALCTVYLYLYPVLQRCSFPPASSPDGGSDSHGAPAALAPFRLLALGDPQLEGDTSLPNIAADGLFPGTRAGFWRGVQSCGPEARAWCGLRPALAGLLVHDVPRAAHGCRKRLDLWGNDRYLAHVYRSIAWWTAPTHTVVLGDLLGSQWIGDAEFARRSGRFWGTVFRGAERVPDEVTHASGRVEVLGQDASWARRVIAVAGNHDIGYAGDIDGDRIARFEEAFGRVNWEIRFRLNTSVSAHHEASLLPEQDEAAPELRLVILNSMNLDSPASSPEHQQQSHDFLQSQLYPESTPFAPATKQATILLTHIPLHKSPGLCVDAPYFSYLPASNGGGIEVQNHLSEHMSAYILDGLAAGHDDAAIILNGHDHEGCNTVHRFHAHGPTPEGSITSSLSVEPDDEEEESTPKGPKGFWTASPSPSLSRGSSPPSSRNSSPVVPELTVRSMMGEFAGNAGLLSAWWDAGQGQWKFEFALCGFGVEHWWWGVHVLDLVVLGLGLGGGALRGWEKWRGGVGEGEGKGGKGKGKVG